MTTVWEIDRKERGKVLRLVEGLLDSDSVDERATYLKGLGGYLDTTVDSGSVVASAIREMVH